MIQNARLFIVAFSAIVWHRSKKSVFYLDEKFQRYVTRD